MTAFRLRALAAALVAAALLSAPAAKAQQGNFLDNLFNRGQPAPQSQTRETPEPPEPQVAQSQGVELGGGDLAGRVSRIENALRQLTGTIEQLQHQNQQLQMQLRRMQDDTEYRLQQLGGRGGAPAPAPAAVPRGGQPPPGTAGQRSDVFDPAQHPNAPGAPRVLGNQTASALPQHVPLDTPIGAPGGRAAGAPLDLSTLAGNAAAGPPDAVPGGPAQAGGLPPPPARNTSATGTQLATLPPSASPKDVYDMAYGYVLHKDYALAEQSFRSYLQKYPNEPQAADARYWLGESQFQQQRYRDAAESFLAVSTKHERSGKAPDSLLRLGQSLAALKQKEAACATFAEVERKFPRASSAVKRNVAREQKREHC